MVVLTLLPLVYFLALCSAYNDNSLRFGGLPAVLFKEFLQKNKQVEEQNLPKLADLPQLHNLPGVKDLLKIRNIPVLKDLSRVQNLPGLHDLPALQDLPGVQELPGLHELPGFQNLLELQNLPGLQGLPGVQKLPKVPIFPGVQNLLGVQGLPEVREDVNLEVDLPPKAAVPQTRRSYTEYLPNDEVPEDRDSAEDQENEDVERSWNRQRNGSSTPGCQNSDTIQNIMKILVYLLKQQKQNETPNTDELNRVIALYKQSLRSSAYNQENLALLNKLVTLENNLKKYGRNGEGAKITVTLELPVSSQPLCMNALEEIVKTAHNSYARLKLSDVCWRNYQGSPSFWPNLDNGGPSLEDLLTGNNDLPLNGDPTNPYNYLNNYTPNRVNTNAQNKPFDNNDPLPNILQPGRKDIVPQRPNDDDRYKDSLLALLNSKKKDLSQTTGDSQKDLLSLALNKLKDNDNTFYDSQRLLNRIPGATNPLFTQILQHNLGNGNLSQQHVTSEGDPTQDLLSQLQPSEGMKPKFTYTNPLQDKALTSEAVDIPNFVNPEPNLNRPNFLKPNLQDINELGFDPYLNQSPTSFDRILRKLKYATFLAKNLNKLKKKQKLMRVLGQNYSNNNDAYLNVLPNQNVYEGPYDNPKFLQDTYPRLDNNYSPNTSQNPDPYRNNVVQRPGDMRDDFSQTQNNVPGGKNVYQLKTSPNQTGVLEMTYLLNRPDTVEPFYFVKYKIPFDTFALNFNKLLREQSFTQRSPETFYKELLRKSSSDVVDASNILRSSLDVNIIDQVLKNGTLLDAKVVDDNSTHGYVEVTVRALPSGDDVKHLINVLDHERQVGRVKLNPNSPPVDGTNFLDRERQIERTKLNPRVKPVNERDFDAYLYRRGNFLDLTNESEFSPLSSKESMEALHTKIRDLWSPNLLKVNDYDEVGEEANVIPRPKESETEEKENKTLQKQ